MLTIVYGNATVSGIIICDKVTVNKSQRIITFGSGKDKCKLKYIPGVDVDAWLTSLAITKFNDGKSIGLAPEV